MLQRESIEIISNVFNKTKGNYEQHAYDVIREHIENHIEEDPSGFTALQLL